MLLRSLPDLALLNRIKRLARCERASTLRVLECLIEIERRKLHFALGYSSMFNFCTSGLAYSGSAAGRRVQTARTVARYPEVRDLLRVNDVNVCTVSRVSRVLTPHNKDEIFSRIRRKSLDEVIAIAAEYRQPEAVIVDRVRDVVVAPPHRPLLDTMPWRKSATGAPANGDAPGNESGNGVHVPAISGEFNPPPDRESIADRDTTGASAPGTPGGDLQHRIILRFGVSAAFMAKLDRIRALAWHRLPANATLEHVFELVLDDTLKRSDPVQRRELRSRREQTRNETGQSSPSSAPAGDTPPHPRQIPLRVRDDVFARDGGRCTYVGPDGRRCDATHGLQIDHIVPVAQGGSGEVLNLRLLCAHHNRLLAERLLGAKANHSQRGRDCEDAP